jgi:RecB family endonuclease NucS
MLEQEMEVAVANCPELFIEPGLTLIRRQALINGRRPDVLFSDGLARHLLVEIQRGRLDEDHLQRHFYYYFDYRAKYPSIHLRLMFIANRLVPQHKEFLDEHGYEFREYPEHDFDRRVHECSMRKQPSSHLFSEVVETPGILPPRDSRTAV